MLSTEDVHSDFIADGLRRFHTPDEVVEIRSPHTVKGTISGYFNDLGKLATAAAKLDSAGVPAVYVTLNPIDPRLLARAQNKVIPHAKHTTADADVLRRRWLPIDCDPVRPAGISSTDAEHAAALSRAREIEAWLHAEFGFPSGIVSDSANGAHLLYRIDTPNDDASRTLIESVLKALSKKFSDSEVSVDLTTYNAARIWKVYHTVARKGENTKDRPHRMAVVIDGPDDPAIVSVELLPRVADLAPKPARYTNGATKDAYHSRFDLDQFLNQHSLTVRQEQPWSGGERRLILDKCPFDPNHTGTSAAILQFEDGAVAFKCQHNGCAGKTWKDVRALLEPGYQDRKEAAEAGQRIIDDILAKPSANGHMHNNTKHETPSESADLSVSCYEEDPKERTKPFPDSAWSGLFGEWRQMAAPCTETSLESLWAAFLLASGMMIGRKVYRYSPEPVYPNFYLLLLGQTGDSRKTTVLRMAQRLLRHAGEDVRSLEGIVSSEGLIEALAVRESTKAIVFADEFRALLAVARRKGTQDLLPRLNSLHGCPEQVSVDRVKNPTTAVNPFLSIVAATPQEYVDDILSDLEITGGFLNRFMIVTGKEQDDKPLVSMPDRDAWDTTVMHMEASLSNALTLMPNGHIGMDPAAEKDWKEYYLNLKKERRAMALKDAQLTARIFQHVMKIAMVYSVLDGRPVITKSALSIAIGVGDWLRSNTTGLFATTGRDHLGKCEYLILDLLLRAQKRRMYRRDLQIALGSRGYNAEVF